MNADIKSLVVSLFLGGAVGAALAFFTVDFAMNGAGLSDFSTFLTTVFGSGWNLGSLAVSSSSEGPFNTFVGISAVYFASNRSGDNVSKRATGTNCDVSQESS